MSYTRHTWENGEVITEAKMNNIEDGIEESGGYDLIIENDWENNKWVDFSSITEQANKLILRKGNFLDLEDKLTNNEPINAILIWHAQYSYLPTGANIPDAVRYMRIQYLNAPYTYARFGCLDANIRGSSSTNSIFYYNAEIYYDADTGEITGAYFGGKAT